MKKLRKLVVLLLAVTMLMSLSLVAMADGTSGTITINDAIDGYTYNIYKVLDLTYNSSTGSYTYTVPDAWVNFFWDSTGSTTASAVSSYVTVTQVGTVYYVTWNDTASQSTSDMQEFGKLIAAYIADSSNGITVAANEVTASNSQAVFSNLDLGYYYVTSSVGSLIALTSTDPDATIVDKNDKPTVDKTVATSNDTTTTWSDYTTADLSDTISFKVVITGIDEITSLTLHDDLPDGYTFSAITSVKLYSSTSDTNPATLAATTDYTSSSNSCTDATNVSACDFEICFDALLGQTATSSNYYAKVLSLTADKEAAYIEVIYTVTVNSSSVSISDTSTATANTNTATITSSTNHVKSDTASVYYFELYVYKYGKNSSDEEVALAGAEFTLSYADGSTTYYAVVSGSDGEYALTSWTTTKADATALTTNSSGIIHIEGLDAGEYTLTETKAPDGYALPASPDSTITITATENTAGDGVESVTVSTTSDVTYNGGTVKATKIENSTSSAMPSTGGIGTTIFYIVGGVLVVGAVILLITRKRMGINEA